MKILYIEDNPDVQRTLQRFFRIYFPDAEVTTTEDAAGSIAALNSATYDVVVSDFDLCHGSGADVLDWCYMHRPWLVTRFIFLTGREQIEASKMVATENLRVKLLGHPHWLVKPTSNATLANLILAVVP